MKYTVEYTLWVTVEADSLEKANNKASDVVSAITDSALVSMVSSSDKAWLDASSNNHITDEEGNYYEE